RYRAAVRRLRLHPGKWPRSHERRGPLARRQRGRQGVLSRLLFRRAQELPRREVLSPAQEMAIKRLASKAGKTEYFDRLETRSPKVREAALMVALPKLVAHAKRNAP